VVQHSYIFYGFVCKSVSTVTAYEPDDRGLSPIAAVPWLRRLVVGFPPRWPGFEPRSGHVGFVVDKVALGRVFREYFCFPCQYSFHRLLHIHHLSFGAGTIGQIVTEVPSGLGFTPPHQGQQIFSSPSRADRLYSLLSRGYCVGIKAPAS
jgi:hypothetical protein